MDRTQLLCTFTDKESLSDTIDDIVNCYDIAFNSIYILENEDDPDEICCTYNIFSTKGLYPPKSTISLHRKKITNTLYTINALNLLIEELNNGVRDKKFPIPWEDYRNCILVTAYGSLKIIRTNLLEIFDTETL